MTISNLPEFNFPFTKSKAFLAVALSCSIFSVSQVKPSPMGTTSTYGAKLSKAFLSPAFHGPFINCMIKTFILLPAALMARPKAAVDFPFPSPVWTIISPLRFLGSAPVGFLMDLLATFLFALISIIF